MLTSTVLTALLSLAACLPAGARPKAADPQADYARSLMARRLPGGTHGYKIIFTRDGAPAADEAYTITRHGHRLTVAGRGAGVIYGANQIADSLLRLTRPLTFTTLHGQPEMKLRGACIGLQKTEYLPGHNVYEYPYTPENFPWFYDCQLWTRYLDLLADSNMNTVYLWNGHPFASLVRLKDYPFAAEVDDKTMALNQQMFTFITTEAQRRGIRVIQMFYNIILSKPFADHYGLKTQDRNRPITPLIADYTRKSIAAFIESYPNVGLLVCLGEAMATVDDDVELMTRTIIPAIRDGLKASHRDDTPPIILRSHDTDCERVLAAALPLYPDIYTMTKYTGESLTTYQPGGPWAETQRNLSRMAPLHISNVHVLANLEPWRWSSPAFISKAVKAMHEVHGANGLHIYPQASYWDWPYTADRLPGSQRELQTDRDWLWYRAWGRYAWQRKAPEADRDYWLGLLADYYGTDTPTAQLILTALDQSGEIAPKLIRRFGITEGNRQTLLLGMRITELVNPYKYTIYPGFYESCGPEGEKLIEWVEREMKGQPHRGELPLDVAADCVSHGQRAAQAADSAASHITLHRDEFERLRSDMHCYSLFATAFDYKVRAAERVLRYKWQALGYVKDAAAVPPTDCLESALALMSKSDGVWAELSLLTDSTYLYANSMQTAQRRIPVGGDGGRMKTWRELLSVYQAETECLRRNILKMKSDAGASAARSHRRPLPTAYDAEVSLHWPDGESPAEKVRLARGAKLFTDRSEPVDTLAPELEGLTAYRLNYEGLKRKSLTVDLDAHQELTMLVGYFKDDQDKFARAPKLETDATANDYGQAEPLLAYGLRFDGALPLVNVHGYRLTPGHHTIRLPKGALLLLGFTGSKLTPRDAELNGGGEVDWLFQE